jgi:TatD DNase family protein
MDLHKSIEYIDLHTHRNKGNADTVAVVNLMAGDSVPGDFSQNTLFSAGIHPWYLTGDNAWLLKSELLLTLAHPHVIAIGEAGFDTMRGPGEEIQYDAFIYQAKLAEELGKPLLIHCVRGWDLLVRARKEINPSVRWIIHGFRGKPLLAQSLAESGFLFSLGNEGLTKDIVTAIGTDKIFLETDDSEQDIKEIYSLFTTVSGIDKKVAIEILRDNFNRLSGI